MAEFLLLVFTWIKDLFDTPGLKERPYNKKAWGKLFIICTIGIIGLIIWKSNADAKAQEELEKTHARDFGALSLNKIQDKVFYIKNGTNRYKVSDGIFDLKDLLAEEYKSIKVLVRLDKDNSLKVSTELRDEKGTLLASIIDNEWKIYQGGSVDKNFSDKAFELIYDGAVVLQIVLSGDEVSFKGVLHMKNGKGIILYSLPDSVLSPSSPSPYVYAPIISFNKGGYEKLLNDYEFSQDFIIAPIFKYPSGLHPGERL